MVAVGVRVKHSGIARIMLWAGSGGGEGQNVGRNALSVLDRGLGEVLPLPIEKM